MRVTLYHGSSELAEGPTLTDVPILRAAMAGGAMYTHSSENVSLECAVVLSRLTGMGAPDSASVSQEEWWPDSDGGTLTSVESCQQWGHQ